MLRTTVVSFVLLFASIANAQLQPIQWPSDAPLADDRLEECKKFIHMEQWLYKEFNDDPPEAREAAQEFLDVMTSVDFGNQFSWPRQIDWENPHIAREKELPELAKTAIEAGSQDPMVLLRYAGYVKDLKERAEYVDKAIERLTVSRYPRGVRAMFLGLRQAYAPQKESKADRQTRERDIHANIPAWFRFAAKHEGSRRDAYRTVVNYCTMRQRPREVESLIKVAESIFEDSEQDPWLATMFLGFAYMEKAWDIRSQRKRENFDDYVQLAAKHYSAAYEIAPDRPEAATKMIEIAMVGGDSRGEQYWFEKAIEAEIDNLPAYKAVLWSLRPRWGHGHEEMLAFADQCVQSDRYDTIIPWMYIIALHDIRSESENWGQVMELPDAHERSSEVLDRYIELRKKSKKGQKPSDEDAFTRNAYARKAGFSFHAGEYADAAQALDEINGKTDDVWKDYQVGALGTATLHAYSEFGDQIRGIPVHTDESQSIKDAKKVNALCRELLAKSKDEMSHPFFRHWIDVTDIDAAYAEGKWVDIQFAEPLSAWTIESGKLNAQDAKSGKLHSSFNSPISIQHNSSFPGPKEITMDVGPYQGTVSWGIKVGKVVRYDSDNAGALFYFRPKSNEIGVEQGYGRARTGKSDETIKRIRVKVWKSDYEFYVNNRLVSSGALQGFDGSDPKIGFGQPSRYRWEGHAIATNLRVRKIAYRSPPTRSKDRIEYYTKRIGEDPQIHDYYFKRAKELASANRTDEAIADLRRAAFLSPEHYDTKQLLARLLLKEGHYNDSLALFQWMADKTEKQPRSHGHALAALSLQLSTVPVEGLRDGKRALEMAEKSLELRPELNATSHLALAAARAELGEYETATTSIRAARNINTEKGLDSKIESIAKGIESEKPFRLSAPAKELDAETAKRNARDLVTSVFPSESMETPQSKTRAARDMLEYARGDLADVNIRLALLNGAKDLASVAGDLRTADMAIEELSDLGIDTKAARHDSVLKALQRSDLSESEKQAIGSYISHLVDRWAEEDRYDLADGLLENVVAATESWTNTSFSEQHSKIQATQKAFEAAERAMTKLESQPDDPTANADAALFLAFYKQRWGAALEHWRRSDHKTFQSIAKRELDGQTDPAEMLKLAKDWQQAAKAYDDVSVNNQMLARGLAWYYNAIPNLPEDEQEAAKEEAAVISGQDIRPMTLDAARTPTSTTEPRLVMTPSGKFVRDARGVTEGRVDLLSWIDPAVNAIEGEWSIADNVLTADPDGNARLVIPVITAEEYEITFNVEVPKEGRREMSISANSPGGNRFTYQFNAYKGSKQTGLELLDGKPCSENETRKSAVFVRGKENRVAIQVRKEGIRVSLNWKNLCMYDGGFHRLTSNPEYDQPGTRQIVLGINQSDLKIKDLSLKRRPNVEVVSAKFGGGKKWTDVTEKIQQLHSQFDGGFWNTPGGLSAKDPTPGWKKKTQIKYKYNGKEKTAWLEEKWFNIHNRLEWIGEPKKK